MLAIKSKTGRINVARIAAPVFVFIILSSYAYASQAALEAAKRNAIEFASTYMTSETHIKDFELEKDLVSAYANATVKIIKELENGWYRDAKSGDCFRVKIKVEVIPDEKAMDKVSKRKDVADDPSAPLHVRLWTDKISMPVSYTRMLPEKMFRFCPTHTEMKTISRAGLSMKYRLETTGLIWK
jgi:hypothetical protein